MGSYGNKHQQLFRVPEPIYQRLEFLSEFYDSLYKDRRYHFGDKVSISRFLTDVFKDEFVEPCDSVIDLSLIIPKDKERYSTKTFAANLPNDVLKTFQKKVKENGYFTGERNLSSNFLTEIVMKGLVPATGRVNLTEENISLALEAAAKSKPTMFLEDIAYGLCYKPHHFISRLNEIIAKDKDLSMINELLNYKFGISYES